MTPTLKDVICQCGGTCDACVRARFVDVYPKESPRQTKPKVRKSEPGPVALLLARSERKVRSP